ncbi:MAG: hypothetical protein WA220_06165, partial [Candidatus Nitrosopolaris sp.]
GNLHQLELVLVQPRIRYNHAMTCLLASSDNKWKKAIRIMLQTKNNQFRVPRSLKKGSEF